MLDVTKPIKNSALGLIGADYFIARLVNTATRHWYKKVELLVYEKPFLFEIFIAEIEGQGGFFHGINHSVTFNDFIQNAPMQAGQISGTSIADLLENAHIKTSENHIAVVHLISPNMEFLDRGKTRLNLPFDVREAINSTMASR